MVNMKLEKTDPCPCGSGKTYEKCCQAWREATMSKAPVAKTAPTAIECNQLIALLNAGRFTELESQARLVLKRYPDSGFAWNLLGISLQMQGKDGIPALQNATKFLPNDAEVHSNLGNALSGIDRPTEAEASYRRALQIKPHNANILCNLGATLSDLGRLGEAETSYRRALQIKPNIAEVHVNLGNVLSDLGRLDEAETSYRLALQIKPDIAEAHSNLGNTLRKLYRLAEAETCLRLALKIEPDFAKAHNNLGIVLQDLGKLDGAVSSFRRALEIEPDYAEAYSNLLFTCNFLPDQHPAQMLAEARHYGEIMVRQARPYTRWHNLPEPGRCLRVGLVSGDFHQHPVGNFLENVLAALSAHAAGRMELFAYFNHSCADAVTGRIKTCCHGWHPAAGLPDEALAQKIYDDGIDILIDLSGHTAHNRLPMFAWKPAPVQVTWLGYLATTGVTAIDYLIADSWVLPETEESHFTEKIWRLPETYLCFTPPFDVGEQVTPLPALTNGYITFGCFNNLNKVNDAVVALWARVLASAPGSRLFLKAKQLKDALVRQSVVERFAAHGIGADRLILKHLAPRAEYLAPYHQVDIALDPFPYTGITTSVESLWMGVPVLTLAGERFLSRQGIGLLMNAGLPEWIAVSADDYVAKAASHAGDLRRLATLRNGLRQQVLASPIFDAPRFAHHFEEALRGMWQKWCDQQQDQSS